MQFWMAPPDPTVIPDYLSNFVEKLAKGTVELHVPVAIVPVVRVDVSVLWSLCTPQE